MLDWVGLFQPCRETSYIMKSVYRTVLNQCRRAQCQRHYVTATDNDVNFDTARPFEDIPGPRGLCNIPIIGPAFFFKPFTHHTLEKLHHLFSELMDTYGPLVRVNLGKWTVLVEDAEDIHTVMKNEGKYPHREIHYIHKDYCQTNGVKEGLVLLQGEEWYNFRSPLNARMARVTCAQHYLPDQNEVADDFVTRIREDELSPEDMFEMIFKYACESLGVVAFNKRLGYLSPDIDSYPDKLQALQDIRDMFRIQNQCLYIHPFLLKNFNLDVKKDYKNALDRIVRHAWSYYESTLDEIKRKKRDGTLDMEDRNIIQSLTMSDRLSVDDMGAMAVDIFSGGTDSTARAIQMLLYVLARNPDKQEKLRQEIINNIGQDGHLTTNSLKNMSYLPACVKESFRLFHPGLCGTQRYLPNDIMLQGYRIPAGTSIVIMSQTSAKNARYFPDPNSYLPERWLRDDTGNRRSPIPSTALTPFGIGSRQCLGKRFAEQEIFLAVTKILQNFEVSLEPGHEDIDVIYQIFIATQDPIRFVFKDRK